MADTTAWLSFNILGCRTSNAHSNPSPPKAAPIRPAAKAFPSSASMDLVAAKVTTACTQTDTPIHQSSPMIWVDGTCSAREPHQTYAVASPQNVNTYAKAAP